MRRIQKAPGKNELPPVYLTEGRLKSRGPDAHGRRRHKASSSNHTFLGEVIMTGPRQDILLFLHKLADFPKLLRGKTGSKHKAVRLCKRYFCFSVVASDVDMRSFHRIAFTGIKKNR